MLVLGTLAVLATGGLSQPSSQAVDCSTYDAATGRSHNGRCTIQYGRSDADAYTETIQAGVGRFVIVYLKRQGQWARVTINGRLGIRYEINRSQFAYSTDGLEISLTVGD